MTIVEPGIRYKVTDTEGTEIDLIFCHKKDGEFVNGITTEMLLEVLVDRQTFFTREKKRDTKENLSLLINLKQALQWARQLNFLKVKTRKAS
jgi:hypothetical protein